MDFLDRLMERGLPWAKVEVMMYAAQPAKHLMYLGLHCKTISRLLNGPVSCAFNGTIHKQKAADLGGRHLTQTQQPKHALGDHTSVARDTTKHLQNKRYSMIMNMRASPKRSKFIPRPGSVTGKEVTKVGGPRVYVKHGRSPLLKEVNMGEPDHTETQELSKSSCDVSKNDTAAGGSEKYIYMGGPHSEQAGSEVKVNDSTMEVSDSGDDQRGDPEDEGLFWERPTPVLQIPGLPIFYPVNTEDRERQKKRKRESMISPESDLPDDLDHDEKRRPSTGQWSSMPAPKEERDRWMKPERQAKRKWESAISPESLLPSEFEHDEKRRKQDISTKSSQVPPVGQQKKGRKQGKSKLDPRDLFCRANAVFDVFQAMETVGALETPQGHGPDAPELDAIDLEILGEEPSDSEKTQPSVNQDLKVIIAEDLYPTVSYDDLRVANAAANLLDIHQGNLSVSELKSVDRQVLKGAFGNCDELQPSLHTEEPSPCVTIPRRLAFSDRALTNVSLMRRHGYRWKPYDKPTGPSEEFRSFFATRRQRKSLLRKGEASWDDEDASFIQTRKKLAEPGAKLGAEYVAKNLLDGRRSPLPGIVRASRKSVDERRMQGYEILNAVEKVSYKNERKIAQMKRSGLKKVEKSESEAKAARSEWEAKGKEFGSLKKVGKSGPVAKPDTERLAILALSPMTGTFKRKQITVPFSPDFLRIGRQPNAETVPTAFNGIFRSKALSRQHAEVWADKETGKIWIQDVSSSNGTFVNGVRLSAGHRDSVPCELREQDTLELGVDVVKEDQSIRHHKVSAKVQLAGCY